MHALRVQADDTAPAAAHLAAAVPEGRAAVNSAAMTVTTCMWVGCRVWARRSNAVASAREPPRAHSAAGCSTYQGHQGDRVHCSGAHGGGGRDLCRTSGLSILGRAAAVAGSRGGEKMKRDCSRSGTASCGRDFTHLPLSVHSAAGSPVPRSSPARSSWERT